MITTLSMPSKRLGLIVNPVAGLGGRVGLKGSDGAAIQRRARALGAVPQAQPRAIQALKRLAALRDRLDLITYPGEMGEGAARACGLEPTVIGSIRPGATTPEDTRRAARAMQGMGVELLLWAGGDGTARDIYAAVGETLPVLGIPAGVKIHSAVYATTPQAAGDLARLYLQGRISSLRLAEVMDIDEEAFRRGVVAASLYGYLKVPYRCRLIQGPKAPSTVGEAAAQAAIACAVVDSMEPDCLYIVGPGTTTRAILAELGLPKTLLGVDVVLNGKLIAADVNEAQLRQLTAAHTRATIIVTPIGGQGFLFGRGNQPIGPEILRRVGRENLIVASTRAKIDGLRGRPLLVDTGDPSVDRLLAGYLRVVTGYNEEIVYRVAG